MTDEEIKATIIYAHGVTRDLENRGILQAGASSITAKGLADYDQLKASSWKPTREMLIIIMAAEFGLTGDELEQAVSVILSA